MVKYLSLFSGIGAFEKALERLKIPYELVGYCEIDPFASKAYSLLHGVPESMNFGDITKLDENSLPDNIDLITYGFPCQDISIAGLQKGLVDESGQKTRSGLFFDALRIIEHTQPQVAIAENVKNLTSKKFRKQFETVLNGLNEAGYNNYYRVLNAMDYEIPQSRERILIVSIRKDIDTGIFEFPEPVELKKCLGDLLESKVPEKYYLSEKMTENMVIYPDNRGGIRFIKIVGHSGSGGQKGFIHSVDGGIGALTATDYKQPKQILVKAVNHEQNNCSC